MTTFETLYPALGNQIGAGAQTSTNENAGGGQWWNTLIQQVPDVLGVILQKPGSNNPQLIYPQAQESILSTNNLVKIAVIAIVILIAYKLIQKI